MNKILQEQKKVKIRELNRNKNSPFSTYQETIMYHDAVWVPSKELQLKVISSYHNKLAAGHPGFCKTKELIQKE